jgi:mono/diheme cytochrome c family protein
MVQTLALVLLAGFVFVALPLPAAAATGASPAEGEKVFVAQKCSLCHAVAGKGNKMGSLDGVGTKLTAAELREWIVDPVAMGKKHGATRKPPMKSFASLPKADIDALVEYLQTLKKK